MTDEKIIKPNDELFHNYRLKFLKEISSSLSDKLVLLKSNIILYDIATIVFCWLLFIGLVYISGYFYKNVVSIVFFIILQGLVIHTASQLIHEYYVHNYQSKFIQYLTACIVPLSPTKYKKLHSEHHKFFPNSNGDPDTPINNPRNIIEKILAFTLIHDLFLVPLRNKKLSSQTLVINYTKKETLQIRIEQLLFIIVFILSIITYLNGYKLLVEGWLLPLILGVPIFTGLRVFSEHGIINKSSPLSGGTNVPVPALLKFTPFVVVFGEGHIIHHYFPSIPWYKINKAIKLLEPYLHKSGDRLGYLDGFALWLFSKK